MSPPLEEAIENALVAGVKALGGECVKFVNPGRTGAPDRIVFLFGTTIFVETKTDGGYVKPWQKRYHDMLRKHGQSVLVLWTIEQVKHTLERLREALKT